MKTVYIEPQKNYDEIVSLLSVEEINSSQFFIPSRVYATKFKHEVLSQHNLDDIKLIDFKTVDEDNDSWLYSNSMLLARKYVDLLLSCSGILTGNKNSVVAECSEEALVISLHDRLVSLIRPFRFFLSFCQKEGISESDFIVKPGSNVEIIDLLFSSQQIAVNYKFEHLSDRAFKYVDSLRGKAIDKLKTTVYALPPIYPQKSKKIKGVNALFVTNLRDAQYKYTSLPVIKEISEFMSLHVMAVYDSVDLNYQDEFTLHGSVNSSKVVIHTKLTDRRKEDIKFLHVDAEKVVNNSLRRFRIFCESNECTVIKGMSGILANYLSTYLPAILIYNKQYYKKIQKIVKSCELVAVLPGRYVESIIAVKLAQKVGKPTYEVQSGTISKSPRFITPIADKVICIDPFSEDVYVNFLGKSTSDVLIMGSPKIDYSLKSHRNADKLEMEKKVFGRELLVGKRVLIATQPVGVDKMGQLLSLIINSFKGLDNFCLSIKQHPNESAEYTKKYKEIISDLGMPVEIITTDKSIYDSIAASDVVCTYFSTVGLEAYALNKRVFAVNPFDSRPPFDLASLGVATEVSSSQEFISELRNINNLKCNVENDYYLKDGLSTKRIAGEFLEAIAKQKRSWIKRARFNLFKSSAFGDFK